MVNKCNKNFFDAKDNLWCGNNACVEHPDSDGDEDKDEGDLRGCPSGYSQNGFQFYHRSWPMADQKKRKCKKNVDSPHWNQLTHKIFKNDVLDNNLPGYDDNLRKAFQCCDGTKVTNTQECGDLYMDPDRDDCSSGKCSAVQREYCTGENLNTENCKEYCKQNENACRQSLRDFCKDKHEGSEREKYKDICACYYTPDFYAKINKQFAEKWNIPEELNDARPQCMSNECLMASIQPTGDQPCPSASIVSCIQNVDIDATGAKMGDVHLEQSAECKNKYTRKESTKDASDDIETKTAETETKIANLQEEISELESKHAAETSEEVKKDLQSQIDSKKAQQKTLEDQKTQLQSSTSNNTKNVKSENKTQKSNDTNDDDDETNENPEPDEDNTFLYAGIAFAVLCIIFMICAGLMLIMT